MCQCLYIGVSRCFVAIRHILDTDLAQSYIIIIMLIFPLKYLHNLGNKITVFSDALLLFLPLFFLKYRFNSFRVFFLSFPSSCLSLLCFLYLFLSRYAPSVTALLRSHTCLLSYANGELSIIVTQSKTQTCFESHTHILFMSPPERGGMMFVHV